MKLLTIFYYEWLALKRGPAKWLVFFISIIAAYSIFYGYEHTKHQLKNIGILQDLNDSTKKVIYYCLDYPKEADTIQLFYADWLKAADPLSIFPFLNENYAINYPGRLSHLSIGQRDVYPLYKKVSPKSFVIDGGDALEDMNSENYNPQKLKAGNFDLAFVILYLFPLFIIAWNYNILSQEIETNTYRLLRNTATSVQNAIAYRFLFRFLISFSLLTTFTLIGYTSTPIQQEGSYQALLTWIFLAGLYLLFWFSICYLIASFKRGSSTNALILAGSWILFLIIIPGAINNYILSNYKITSRNALLHAIMNSDTWGVPDTVTLQPFYKEYPQYAQYPIRPLWLPEYSFDSLGVNKKLTYDYQKKYLLWYYTFDTQAKEKIKKYKEQIILKRRVEQKFYAFNPPSVIQNTFNDLALSGYTHQRKFMDAAENYRDTIFKKTLYYVFSEKNLTKKDYQELAQLNVEQFTSDTDKINAYSFYIVLAWVVLLIAIGFWRFKRL